MCGVDGRGADGAWVELVGAALALTGRGWGWWMERGCGWWMGRGWGWWVARGCGWWMGRGWDMLMCALACTLASTQLPDPLRAAYTVRLARTLPVQESMPPTSSSLFNPPRTRLAWARVHLEQLIHSASPAPCRGQSPPREHPARRPPLAAA
eukprot:52718-Chlamydomonas_euryale.AAC.1